MALPPIAVLLRDAARSYQQGRLTDVEKYCRSALARDPQNFDALYLVGLVMMQQGRLNEASVSVSAAVKRNPASAAALMLLGSLMLTQRRFDDALKLFDRAIVAEPQNLDARYNQAVALGQVGNWKQALVVYDHLLGMRDDLPAAWFNRGVALVELGRHQDAIESFERALTFEPGNANVLNNRGNALAILCRHEEAVESFDRALTLQPGNLHAWSNRATSLNTLGRYDDALLSADRALAINPHHSLALGVRGNVLHAMGRFNEAVAAYDRALAGNPSNSGIVINRGISLLELGRFEDALANAERAVVMDPRNALAYVGRAKALQGMARYEDAIRDYEKAVGLDPNVSEGRHNLATCYLCLGRFREGWHHYKSQEGELFSSVPRWDGSRILGTLLVWCEEGVGDQILYSTILSEVSECAGRVIVAVDKRLLNLFSRSFPDLTIVTNREVGALIHEIEAQTVTSGLARFRRLSFDSFPQGSRAHLRADQDRTRALRKRLSDGRPVIGLSWISKNIAIGRFKSLELKALAPLLRTKGYRFVDLQYGDTEAERLVVERELGVKVERLDDIDNMNDIDGLAALISACDVILTVSNTTAHLAGALGVPTFVMIAHGRGRIWYWFPKLPVSPWYSRLFVKALGKNQSWPDLVVALKSEVLDCANRSFHELQNATK